MQGNCVAKKLSMESVLLKKLICVVPLYLICIALVVDVLAGLRWWPLRNDPAGVSADLLLQYEGVMEFIRSSALPEHHVKQHW